MKLIVGLGNVGVKYAKNRHNVGFVAIDKLSSKLKNNKNVVLLKPDTMMNSSGKAVKNKAIDYKLQTEDIYVIHDDLDLKLGEYKIQRGRGPKIHNGVNSIENSLGTPDFWRVRVGIDNRDPDNRSRGEEYVLQDFTSEEERALDRVLDEICRKLVTS